MSRASAIGVSTRRIFAPWKSDAFGLRRELGEAFQRLFGGVRRGALHEGYLRSRVNPHEIRGGEAPQARGDVFVRGNGFVEHGESACRLRALGEPSGIDEGDHSVFPEDGDALFKGAREQRARVFAESAEVFVFERASGPRGNDADHGF